MVKYNKNLLKDFIVKKMLILILTLFVAFYFLLTHYFSDVQINKYDSIETVKERKAIEEGWIPKSIPASAYDIVETHDSDTDIIFGKFSYKEKDEADFLLGLKQQGEVYIGDKFLFKIDKVANLVNFRSVPVDFNEKEK